VWERRVLAAWRSQGSTGIWIFQRGKKVDELQVPNGSEAITNLLVFGSWIVGSSKSKIHVWRSADLGYHTTIDSQFTGESAKFTSQVVTMPTLLNKIFVGKTDGTVEIWNVNTGKMVYALLPSRADSGAITALQPAPALNILAIAYESGTVILRNVKTDRALITVKASDSPSLAVTSISFRTDDLGAGEDGQKSGVMATTSRGSGDITFWDLNHGGRRTGTLRGAHLSPSISTHVPGGVTKIEFLAGQAVLASAGLDNSLKTWIFDALPFSPIPRVLHSRGGHAAPVSNLKFLSTNSDGADSEGKWLLSSSQDRSFWAWSLRRDGQSSELSQGNIRKKAKSAGLLSSASDVSSRGTTLEDLKAPKITSIACSLNRDGGMGTLPGTTAIWTNEAESKNRNRGDGLGTDLSGWESVLTGHEGDKFARTWFWGRKRAGRWKFPTSDGGNVTSVAVSPCGTFALIGSANGSIDMFNLQSGIHRQRFPVKLTEAQAKKLEVEHMHLPWRATEYDLQRVLKGHGKHRKAVTGLEVDSLNKTVISCGDDGMLKFWDFQRGILLHELNWSQVSITAMRFHRSSDLIALACDDCTIRVVDIETRRLVRELHGATERIVDVAFSNDGRWIVCASADSIVRVHDLASGHLLESLRFASQPVAVGFSPTGEFLATAHADSVGINLWTNRTLFGHAPTRRRSPLDIVDVNAPTASGEGGTGLLEDVLEGENEEDEEDEVAASNIEQLSSDLQTLSLVPKARWQTLLNLEVIRERNKPKEPPKKPENAPFFLPSMINPATNLPMVESSATLTIEDSKTTISKSRISQIADPSASATTQFTIYLSNFRKTRDSTAFVAYLSTLPPSATDLAIRTLDPTAPYLELVSFIEALTARLKQKRDYELIQTWMAVFLRCHSSLVLESEQVRTALEQWRDESKIEGERIGDSVGYVRGVMGWVGGVV
jgi:U3 small nucleolar RNA-associated protein 21